MKILLTFTIAWCISLAASAQSDTQQKGDTSSQVPYENKDDVLYRNQGDMVAITADNIPQELRSTLKQSRYQGWEQGSLLRSSDGKIYELRMNKGNKSKVYRFDAQGKAVKD